MAGLLDFVQGASKGFWAGNLGAPVDMATLAVNGLIAGGGYAGHNLGLLDTPPSLIEKPVGGSEWIADKMRGVGLLKDNPGSTADTYGQVAGGLLGPLIAAKSPQIANGLLRASANLSAPTALNKQSGVILATGYTPKSGLPESIRQNRVTPIAKSLPPNPRYDTVGNVYDDMNLRIAKLQDGNYVAQYDQPWMGKVKPFYATGDDVDELLSYGLDRIQRSQSASTAAAKRQYRATLLGQLEVGGMDPNDFQLAKSQRSSSTYLTHIPSGTKVRVSDHDLPLGYEQPDIDLRHSQSVLEQAEKVLKYLRQ